VSVHLAARRGYALALSLSVVIAACSPERGPQTGSQTNWLKACRNDAECGGLRCLCGACTASCDAEADCADLTGASCVSADDAGAIALCDGDSPSSPGLCLSRCDDGQCADGTACVAGVCAPLREPTTLVTVDSSVRYQTLVGFGAGTVWLTDEIVQHPAAPDLYDAMFAESGFDVIRLLNRYDDYGTSDLTTSVEIMSAATERLGTRPTLLLTSTSPPAALKASGDEVCSGNPDTCTLAQLTDGSFDYPGFAGHWRATLQAYAAAGIEPDYISIQNDPDWVPPTSGHIDACRFLPTEGTATVDVDGTNVEVEYPGYAEAMAAVMEALADLPSVPLIAAPDTVGVQSTVRFASQLDLASIDAIAHHMYGTEPSAVDRDALLALNDLGQQSGLPIFQTEMQAEGLETAILMHEALSTIGASAYLQNDFAVSAFLHTPNPTAFIALTETDFTIQDPYHAMRHFARDTDPGWVRVAASSDAEDVLDTAWLSPEEDALTVVLVNPAPTECVIELAFSEDTPMASHVTRTVFAGIERTAELGALPPEGIITLPGHAIVTVALQR
jgi:glucuronoarabinoxylan endo-1,4-beta-xylanase